MGVPDDIARVYVRVVPLLLMGIDGETAKKLAWQSDTPRKAGGLMSWAASKAVGPLV